MTARFAPWVLALAAALVAGGAVRACQGAERARGATEAALGVAEARADSLAARRAVVETRYRRDTLRLTRTLATVDTLRDSLTITDTVEVVRFIGAQDSAIVACRAVVATCDVRVALADSLTRNAENRLMLTRSIRSRPWTSAGLAYDPHAARWGGYLDRDWSRLRAGLTVVPDERTLRLGLRIGMRW